MDLLLETDCSRFSGKANCRCSLANPVLAGGVGQEPR
jgi:hypothetical protein